MRKAVLALAAILATIVLIGVGQVPAHADVTGVKGSAYGYFASVSLFGGPSETRGPSPSVTLPPSGSPLLTASQQTGLVQIGPAIFFSSGQLTVSTQGTTGPSGSVTSSANIQSVNTSGQEVFTATSVSSTCTASEGAGSGSTTINGGTLQTDSGLDANSDGDFTDAGEHPPVAVSIAANPAPNKSYDGHIHVNGSIDSFRYVFNEQVVNPDGSITVNAAHEYFLGPTAVGELIVGQSVCGVTAPDTTAPKVNRVVPKENASGISPRANVSAIFSEAMRGDSINTNTVKLFKKGSTTPIGAVVSYDASTKKATLNPNANLKRGAKYKAIVTTGAQDLAGNGLDQDPTLSGNQPKQWFFTVRN